MTKTWLVSSVAAAVLTMSSVPALAQIPTGSRQLMEAVKTGDGAMASELLLANPSLVNVKNYDGETPLVYAIKLGKEDWTGFLINKGADVNAPNRDGDTPLILAARMGSETSVGWLIEKNAKVDLNNKIGETALISAVQNRNVAIAQRLLAAGADPNKNDYSGHSARDYAKRDDRNPRMLKLFEDVAQAVK